MSFFNLTWAYYTFLLNFYYFYFWYNRIATCLVFVLVHWALNNLAYRWLFNGAIYVKCLGISRTGVNGACKLLVLWLPVKTNFHFFRDPFIDIWKVSQQINQTEPDELQKIEEKCHDGKTAFATALTTQQFFTTKRF